jgi:hypothetical protein
MSVLQPSIQTDHACFFTMGAVNRPLHLLYARVPTTISYTHNGQIDMLYSSHGVV